MFHGVAFSRSILSLSALVSTSLVAQGPDRAGDSSVVAPTYAAIQIMYDSAASPAFAFLSGNVLEIAGANATEIQARFLKGSVARVIEPAWERRVFWNGRVAAFSETSGCPALLSPGERDRPLLSARTVREMMRNRAPTLEGRKGS